MPVLGSCGDKSFALCVAAGGWLGANLEKPQNVNFSWDKVTIKILVFLERRTNEFLFSSEDTLTRGGSCAEVSVDRGGIQTY